MTLSNSITYLDDNRPSGHKEKSEKVSVTLRRDELSPYGAERSHTVTSATPHQVAGDLDQARHHWRQVLAIYTDLGVPDADDVRAQLIAVDQAAGNDNGDHHCS